DRALLERVRLLLERELVLFALELVEIVRALRFEKRTTEVIIDLGDVVRRGRGHLAGPVLDEFAERVGRLLHGLPLAREILLERLHQPDLDEAVVERLGQRERGDRREVARAVRTLGAGARIGRNDALELRAVALGAVGRLVDARQLGARLERELEGPREDIDVAAVDAHRRGVLAGLLVELRRERQRAAALVLVLRFDLD